MSKRTQTRLIKYGSCFLIVLLLAGSYVCSRYVSALNTEYQNVLSDMAFGEKVSFYFQHVSDFGAVKWYHWICDGLTLPSAILLSAGLMIWISNAGVFDLLAFTGRAFLRMFQPDDKKSHGTYGDYVAEKREKRIHGYGFLLISGAISMGLTILFLVLFFAVS